MLHTKGKTKLKFDIVETQKNLHMYNKYHMVITLLFDVFCKYVHNAISNIHM